MGKTRRHDRRDTEHQNEAAFYAAVKPARKDEDFYNGEPRFPGMATNGKRVRHLRLVADQSRGAR